MSEANTDVDGVNPALWRLKHEAEAEVKRLSDAYEQAEFGTAVRSRLRTALAKAEQRLATEITSIRQAALPESLRGGSFPATNELTELLEAGMRVLTDYTPKLDRINDSVLEADRYRQEGLGREFLAVSEPLRWWILKLSAVHEEGRLTEVQRMELRLRLSELESKFSTAGRLLRQLNLLGPT